MSEENTIVVGIIVGHNELDQGCKAYNGRSEYSFCSEVADLVDGKIIEVFGYQKSIKFKKVLRPNVSSYKDQCKMVAQVAKQIGASFCINLHLNSFDVDIRGCEGLILEESDHLAAVIASEFTKYLNEKMFFKNRGIKFLNKSHRGFSMLEHLRLVGVPACIVEPCFVAFENDESRMIMENPDYYADAVIYAAREATIAIFDKMGENTL